MRNFTGRWLGFALLLSALVCGCGQRDKNKKSEQPSQRMFVYQDLDPKQILDTLEKRYRVLRNFSTQPIKAVIENKLSPFGREQMSGSLVLEKPNKLRLSLAKAHSPLRIDALCDGKMFWLVNHPQKVVYYGKLDEPLNNRGRTLAFNPVDLFNAIFSPETTRDAPFKYRIMYVEVPSPDRYVVVVLNSEYPNKLYSKIWVDRSTLHIVRHQLYKPDVGEVKLDAFFSDFAEKTRYEIPHGIVMKWPEAQATLKLHLQGVKTNRTFKNPQLFTYDYADKGYGRVCVTGPDVPPPGSGLKERDSIRPGSRSAPPARPPLPGARRYPMAPGTRRR